MLPMRKRDKVTAPASGEVRYSTGELSVSGMSLGSKVGTRYPEDLSDAQLALIAEEEMLRALWRIRVVNKVNT